MKAHVVMIPHGLLHLRAQLEAHGHEVDILDFNCPGESRSIGHLQHFDAVGLSVMSVQLRHATEIADALQDRVRVVWGGVHCMLDPLSIMKRYPHHFVVMGEGEIPIVRLTEYLEGKQSVEWLRTQEGICFTDKEPVMNRPFINRDLNELADIDFFRLPRLERYIRQRPLFFDDDFPHLTYLASRGCHWNCSFCINSVYRKHGARYRQKSIDKVRRETERVLDNFDIHLVWCLDEDFFLDKKYTDEWKIYAKEKQFYWFAQARFNYFHGSLLSEDRIRDLVQHGLFQLGMSIETGSEDVRNKVINKQVKDSDITQSVQRIANSVGDRLSVSTSFIVFFPGDTPESRRLIIWWMDYLTKRINIAFTGPLVYRPYPGTKLYEIAEQVVLGDLDYYTNKLHPDGSDLSRADNYEAAFYSEIVRVFFHSRFRNFSLRTEASGAPSLVLGPKGGRPGWTEQLRLVATWILMVPILARLRVNFWGCFLEPHVYGFLVVNTRKLLGAWRRINNRFRSGNGESPR